MTTFDEAVLCGFAHLTTVLRWAGGGWPTRDLDIERRSCKYSPATAEAAYQRLSTARKAVR